jgi:hypothetical protein
MLLDCVEGLQRKGKNYDLHLQEMTSQSRVGLYDKHLQTCTTKDFYN